MWRLLGVPFLSGWIPELINAVGISQVGSIWPLYVVRPYGTNGAAF